MNLEYLVKSGEAFLKEAILQCLLKKYGSGYGVGAAEIGRITGIFRKGGTMNDAIVTGCMYMLQQEKRVERCAQKNGSNGWTLTKKEYTLRK